jgi:hypothetical protein
MRIRVWMEQFLAREASRCPCPGHSLVRLSEYFGEEAGAASEARIKALSKTFEDVEMQSKEISAAMLEFDENILGHRLYHEAPNDVFELIVLQCSDVVKDKWGCWVGNGGLNVLRLVSKRCMQVVESVATRLTHKAEADSLTVAALKRCSRIEHIGCDILGSLEGCSNGLRSLVIMGGSTLESLEPISACKELETADVRFEHH